MDTFISLLIFLVVVYLIYYYNKSSFGEVSPNDQTIFVSVASFRDIECTQTLDQLFSKAKNRDRIYVGVCEQNKTDEESCTFNLNLSKEFINEHVRKVIIPYSIAKGPTKARYYCSTLYNGEDYFMQIDSHSQFAQNWDESLINMIKTLQSMGYPKPLLSNYPVSKDEINNTTDDNVPVLCESNFNDNKIPFFMAHMLSPKLDAQIPFCSGGLIFTLGKILNEVPYDPDLPYLFTGEELLYSARAWTSGYDIFSPDKNVIFHHYTREDSPKVWNDVKNYNAEYAETKVRAILKIPLLNDPEVSFNELYGLGKMRTVEDYFKFAGLDPENKVSKSKDIFCKR